MISLPITLVISSLLSPTTGWLMRGKNQPSRKSRTTLQRAKNVWPNGMGWATRLLRDNIAFAGRVHVSLTSNNEELVEGRVLNSQSQKTSPLVPIRGGCLLCKFATRILPSRGLTTVYANVSKTCNSNVHMLSHSCEQQRLTGTHIIDR